MFGKRIVKKQITHPCDFTVGYFNFRPNQLSTGSTCVSMYRLSISVLITLKRKQRDLGSFHKRRIHSLHSRSRVEKDHLRAVEKSVDPSPRVGRAKRRRTVGRRPHWRTRAVWGRLRASLKAEV